MYLAWELAKFGVNNSVVEFNHHGRLDVEVPSGKYMYRKAQRPTSPRTSRYPYIACIGQVATPCVRERRPDRHD